jgi:hypothetical protein
VWFSLCCVVVAWSYVSKSVVSCRMPLGPRILTERLRPEEAGRGQECGTNKEQEQETRTACGSTVVPRAKKGLGGVS